MNSRKWKPKSPATPSASVAAGTFQACTRTSPGTLPIVSASPVSRNGGTCESDAPSAASVPHSRIAPSAARIGADIGTLPRGRRCGIEAVVQRTGEAGAWSG